LEKQFAGSLPEGRLPQLQFSFETLTGNLIVGEGHRAGDPPDSMQSIRIFP
jgi:hypothetical protein